MAKKDPSQKRKKVNVRPIERKHAGKIVAPYKLMEALVAEHHERLKEATILLCWRKGWKPDVDGVLKFASIKKASDLDRAIGSQFGDGYDYVMQLNEEVWSALSELRRRIILDHELCHAAPDKDRDGNQKRDEKERLCWRLRKHPIQEFPEIIQRYGADEVLNLNEAMLDAREAAGMPLFNEPATEGESTSDGEWRNHGFDALAKHKGVTGRHVKALEKSRFESVGQLADHMDEQGEWWHKEIPGISGDGKAPIEDAIAALRA